MKRSREQSPITGGKTAPQITWMTRERLRDAIDRGVVRLDDKPNGTFGFSFARRKFSLGEHEIVTDYRPIDLTTGTIPTSRENGDYNPGIPADDLALMREEVARMEAEKKIKNSSS